MADSSSQGNRQWSGKTGGGNFGQRFLFSFLKKVKVKWLYPFLYPVVPFYCVINHKAFGNIFWYFNEIHHFTKWKSFWMTVHNHFIFGKVVLDRFAIMAGRGDQFKVEVTNRQLFEEMLSQPGGFIVAGSHVGNLELMGHFFSQDSKTLNVVIFGGENESLQGQRRKSFTQHNVNDIPVSDDLNHIFAIKTALDRGEVVILLCDRIFGSSKTLEVDFFGHPAKLLQRVGMMGLNVTITDKATDFLVKEGWDSNYGARPLKRAIQKHVEDILAEEILQNEGLEAATLIVDYDDLSEGLVVKKSEMMLEEKTQEEE